MIEEVLLNVRRPVFDVEGSAPHDLAHLVACARNGRCERAESVIESRVK